MKNSRFNSKLLIAVFIMELVCSFFSLCPITIYADNNSEISVENYIENLSKLSLKYDDNLYSKIVVDKENNTIQKDNGEAVSLDTYNIDCNDIAVNKELVPAQPVLDMLGEDFSYTENDDEKDGIVEYYDDKTDSIKKEYVGYISTDTVEDKYNVKTKKVGNKIIITSPYQTKRLYVTIKSSKINNTYGAVEKIYDGKGGVVLQYSTEDATEKAVSKLKKDSNVLSVQVDEVLSVSSIPDRPASNTIQSDRYIDYLKSNNKTTSVKVAVIDTGAETTHSLLKNRLVTGYNFISKSTNMLDDNGHGTHVSGIVVDNTPSNVKVMPIKVMDSNGNGTSTSISAGIDYAVKKGCKVINMSLGGDCTSTSCPIYKSVIAAVKAGVTVCVAAGNEAGDTKNVCPANITSAITVAACSPDGNEITNFTNYGSAVDITAPGDNILSSYPGDCYEYLSGTSMACPFVSACAALMVVDNPASTPAQVETKLKSSCADMLVKGNDKYTGAGLINLGILLGDKNILADCIGNTGEVEMGYFKHAAHYFAKSNVRREDEQIPTDRSYTVSNSNPVVATFDGRFVVPKGAGETDITITLASGKSFTTKVKLNKCEVWTDYAASFFASGNGTSSSPYIIKTASQLAKLANDLRTGKTTYKGKYFKLNNDIDLAGKYWISITYIKHTAYYEMSLDSTQSFQGTFDGGNHKIKNMTTFNDALVCNWGDFSPTNCEWYNGNSGLFGEISGATIKNVGLENAYSITKEFDGLLTGDVYQNSRISNCYTSGFTAGNGLFGSVNNYNIKVSNCYSSATVLGSGIANNFYASKQGPSVIVNNTFFCGTKLDNDGINSSLTGGFTCFLQSADSQYLCKVYNCFSATTSPNNIGFSKENTKAKVYKSYYLNTNKYGIKTNKSTSLTQLSARKNSDFKSKSFYTTKSNWNSGYYWDFDKTWAISSSVNNGYPYLKNNKPISTTNNTLKYWKDYASKSYAGGSGTSSDPYLISNASQLSKLARDYQFGGGKGKYFKLTADINLAGKEWYPIGAGIYLDITENSQIDKKRYVFYGNIDGGGHTISNMTVNAKGDYLAFASYCGRGYIKNINFKNANVKGNSCVSIVAARTCEKHSIYNCNVDGSVVGNDSDVSGVVGYNDNPNCVIANVHCTASVETKNGDECYGILGNGICYIIRCSYVSPSSHTFFSRYHQGIEDSYCISSPDTSYYINSADNKNFYCAYDTMGYVFDKDGKMYDCINSDYSKMKDKETYSTFDFDSVWNFNEGEYPTLKPYTYKAKAGYTFPTAYWGKSNIATSYAGGKGTKSNPYLIGSVSQLLKMRADVMEPDFYGKYFRLIRNIDMGGRYLNYVSNGGNVLTEFYLDGNNKTISNLILKNGEGLFEYSNYGYIKNLKLRNVQGGSSASLLTINNGVIENCSVTGDLRNYREVSGLCAYNHGTISKCWTNVKLTRGDANITWYNNGTISNSFSISNNDAKFINTYTGNSKVSLCYDVAEKRIYQKNGGCIDTTELSNKDNYSGFDFTNVWDINPDANGGKPTLKGKTSKKITYNLNGGKNPSYQAYDFISGQTVQLKNPTRDFYVFKGWYTDKALKNQVTYISAATKDDVTLYAKWAVGYKVVYHSNVSKEKTKTQTIERNVSTQLTGNSFTRKGYKFKGWATSKKGKVVYKNKASVKNIAKSKGTKHLYAVWVKK